MQNFLISLEAVLGMILLGVAGFFIVKRRILPENVLGVLSPLVLDIALPCMVFANIAANFYPERLAGWYQMPIYWLGFTVFLFLLTLIFRLVAKPECRNEFAMSLFYQNALFVPTGIIIGLYGRDSEHLLNLFLFAMFYPAFFFNTYHLFFRNKARDTFKFSWTRLFNPVLAATLLAALLGLLSINDRVPGLFMKISRQIGDLTIPLIMMILGGSLFLSYRKKEKLFKTEIVKFVIIKNLIFPALTLLLVYWFKPGYSLALMLVLQSAVPPVTAVPVLTERAGGNAGLVNQFLFASILFSTATIPLALSWLNLLYG